MQIIRLVVVLFGLLFYSCQNSEPKQDKPPILANKDSVVFENKDTVPKVDSVKEKRREEINTSKFPYFAFSKVILYKLDAIYAKTKKSVFYHGIEEFKELDPKDVELFLKLLNSKRSYGNVTAACHDPRIGLTFHNEEGKICAHLTLCLECNNISSKPELNLGFHPDDEEIGFSIKSRKKLRAIFEKWGYPDTAYSTSFDK